MEKVKEIKSREKELLKAKEELFESENLNESPSDENIEIKLKIEKPESNLPEPKPKEIKVKPNATVTRKEKNGTNIEIKLKIEKESEEEQDPELKDKEEPQLLSKQEKSPNTTDEGLVEKIHEIKQKQKEIKVAKESIINELDEEASSLKDVDNEGEQNNTESEELPNTTAKDVTKDRIVDKIHEMKSKEVDLKEAAANFIIDAATTSTKNASMNSKSKNLTDIP